MIDYDSRRTGNGSLDAGSTPAYSILRRLKLILEAVFYAQPHA